MCHSIDRSANHSCWFFCSTEFNGWSLTAQMSEFWLVKLFARGGGVIHPRSSSEPIGSSSIRWWTQRMDEEGCDISCPAGTQPPPSPRFLLSLPPILFFFWGPPTELALLGDAFITVGQKHAPVTDESFRLKVKAAEWRASKSLSFRSLLTQNPTDGKHKLQLLPERRTVTPTHSR